jgi:methylenetetrahydrofolate dehydrogenase (NADP+)/methenyltetrahydrofolate cyclohydrolase
MIVNGKAIAEDIYSQLEKRRTAIDRTVTLGIIVGGVDQAIESFIAIKKRSAERLRIDVSRTDVASDAGTEDVIRAVREIAPKVDGIIVQLPLPAGVDVNAALSSIPDDKDVDSISTATSEHVVEAPVAFAAVEILRRADIDPKGKRVVIIGAGRLVGAPTAQLLKKLGAEVSVVTLDEGSMHDVKEADILVCGAGNPGFIRPEHLKQGVAIIDAGTSEQAGKVVGDCDPSCADIASVFTPVPGGVGPVAVAMIFKNLLDLIENK